jgi:hypothetical protein
MDHQHLELVVVGGSVSAEALEPSDMGLERLLEVGIPLRGFGLVELVQQVASEFEEPRPIERLRERFGDTRARLLGIHGC